MNKHLTAIFKDLFITYEYYYYYIKKYGIVSPTKIGHPCLRRYLLKYRLFPKRKISFEICTFIHTLQCVSLNFISDNSIIPVNCIEPRKTVSTIS